MWVITTDYVYRVFERQCAIALDDLARICPVVDDRIAAVYLTGTDFGTQTGLFISPKTYRELYKPFHRQLNDWVHQNTNWKCFIHSCGAIMVLMPDLIEAGFDIFNPVQASAAGMDPGELKARFGDQITFWGGGVDTQQTLPFGSPEAVRAQVRERIRIFGRGGGFVFNPIHNVLAGVPVENLLALYQAVRDFREYPRP